MLLRQRSTLPITRNTIRHVKPATLRSVLVVAYFFCTLKCPALTAAALIPASLHTLDTLRPAPAHMLKIVDSLRQEGYLAAALDTTPNSQHAIFTGPMMQWTALTISPNIQPEWLRSAGWNERPFQRNKALRYTEVLRQEERLLEWAENNGYPFARIWLDSIIVQPDGGVAATLRMERGRFFKYKSLKINGEVRLPKGFMQRYLDIEPGAPYRRSDVLRSRERLRELPYIDQSSAPTVTFAGDEAIVNLWLQKRRASRFDFIVGLLPRPESDPRGGVLVTGALNTAFANALGLGERFVLDFERLRPETQKLEVNASVPYVLGSAFGADGRLLIFRRDSTWVDAQGHLGVQYLMSATDQLSVFWESKSSNVLRVDTNTVLATRRLPPNLDFRQQGLGIESNWTHLDYRFNPRKGWAIQVRGVAARRVVQRSSQIEELRNPQFPEFEYRSLYDTVALTTNRFRTEGRAEVFVPIMKRSTILLRARGGGLFSESPIYQNEQYRLGGNRLLRGFDEESLFATRWAVATAELRLLLGPNSFMGVFTDYGYVENITDRTRVLLRPWGVGAGMNFEVAAGIFGISAAVGRRDVGTGFDTRGVKFHLGYVAVF
jgi:outer membrane protein assembly factor BamA